MNEEIKNENNLIDNICYSCKGLKKRLKKVKLNNKWNKIEIECKACQGKGIILRTRRRRGGR